MITRLVYKFCSFSNTRFYNNKFEWAGDKWNAQFTFYPPLLHKDGYEIKILQQSSMKIAVFLLEDKFKRGRQSELYNMKMQDTIKLSIWKPSNPPLCFITKNKIISFQKSENVPNSVVISFYDKDLSEDLKTKRINVARQSFELFLNTLNSGFEEITNGNQQKLSYIHKLIKEYPPVTK